MDDEVRDRAALYLSVQGTTFRRCICERRFVDEADLIVQSGSSLTIFAESVYSLAALETRLVAYVKDSEASHETFDASSVPKIGGRTGSHFRRGLA